jgi:hypothetical protein
VERSKVSVDVTDGRGRYLYYEENGMKFVEGKSCKGDSLFLYKSKM